MKGVELYAQVRYAVQIEGVSRREAARRFGIDPQTVAKMLLRHGGRLFRDEIAELLAAG